MSQRTQFLIWGALFVVVSIVLGSFLANVVALGNTFPRAMSEAIGSLFNGVAVFVLYVPVALVCLSAADLVKRRSPRTANIIFLIGVAPILYMYGIAHWEAAIAMYNGKWTAAALSIGMFSGLALVWAVVVGLTVKLLFKRAKPLS
jgi:uncharacterized membrane protein YidH (DUF202 family)